MSVRVAKRAAMAAGVVVLGVAAVLVVGAVVSFVVGERGGSSAAQAGVTVSGGEVVVEACSGRGIGKVVIQRGAGDVDGSVVWSATSASRAADTVPVSRAVEGYTVTSDAGPLEPGGMYAVRVLTDSAGRPMIDSYLEFKPEDLQSGQVTLTGGRRVSVSTFRQGTSPCK